MWASGVPYRRVEGTETQGRSTGVAEKGSVPVPLRDGQERTEWVHSRLGET